MHLLLGSLILFIFFLGIYLFLLFYVGQTANTDPKAKADAILVLGAKSYHGSSYNPCLVSRVAHAVDLYNADYAPKILFSGGTDKEDQVNEAETMQKIASDSGVPENNILLETKSTSTYENLLFSQKVLQSNNLNSIIIVTEPFHVARTALVAKKIGLNFSVSPASDSPCWTKWKYLSRYFLKEPFAILWYKIQNKL
jgi:uncharacterized SAM-binding protein YcdF (DUF218 family)